MGSAVCEQAAQGLRRELAGVLAAMEIDLRGHERGWRGWCWTAERAKDLRGHMANGGMELDYCGDGDPRRHRRNCREGVYGLWRRWAFWSFLLGHLAYGQILAQWIIRTWKTKRPLSLFQDYAADANWLNSRWMFTSQ